MNSYVFFEHDDWALHELIWFRGCNICSSYRTLDLLKRNVDLSCFWKFVVLFWKFWLLGVLWPPFGYHRLSREKLCRSVCFRTLEMQTSLNLCLAYLPRVRWRFGFEAEARICFKHTIGAEESTWIDTKTWVSDFVSWCVSGLIGFKLDALFSWFVLCAKNLGVFLPLHEHIVCFSNFFAQRRKSIRWRSLKINSCVFWAP